MKICPKCMAENGDDAKFCKLCASPFQQSGQKTCPNGIHIMDPSWTDCRYCNIGASAGASGAPPIPPLAPKGSSDRSRTVVEGDTASGLRQARRSPTYSEHTPLPPRSAPRPFIPPAATPSPKSASSASEAKPAASTDRKTVYGGAALTPTPSIARGPKIVGMLITYSWVPEGKIYEVREGRNLIGRDPKCEICVPEDETLSGVNSHITYRQSFSVGDMVSMMGTDLDGAPVEQFHALNSYAIIRAGSTHFTFVAVQPLGGHSPGESAS